MFQIRELVQDYLDGGTKYKDDESQEVRLTHLIGCGLCSFLFLYQDDGLKKNRIRIVILQT